MSAWPPAVYLKGKPLVGHVLEFRRDPLGFLNEITRRHGNLVRFKLGHLNIYLVNEPEIIKDVLVNNHKHFVKSRGLELAKVFLGQGLLTSEGEFHLRQRRLVQPAFHHERITGYGQVMSEYTARMRDQWTDGQNVDVCQEMTRLTLQIVAKTLFGANVESETREIGRALTEIMHLFSASLTLPFPSLLRKLPFGGARRFQRARDRLNETVYRIIDQRRASGKDRGDLLSMLLLAQDEEGDGTGMTNVQVRDEAMTLFLAGHETTANALTWTWYLLSQYREVESRLHEEVDRVLDGRLPAVGDVGTLNYTERVLTESMRLYPPAWTIGRKAISDYRIGDFRVPAESIILMSQYVTHRDARFYPDPSRFDPDRWLPDAAAQRPRFSYFPFGGGPRVCIGEQFAWIEGIIMIATIAQVWRMSPVPGLRVEPHPLVTLRPKYGMQMILRRRERAGAAKSEPRASAH